MRVIDWNFDVELGPGGKHRGFPTSAVGCKRALETFTHMVSRFWQTAASVIFRVEGNLATALARILLRRDFLGDRLDWTWTG
jgi:hypothetical protein